MKLINLNYSWKEIPMSMSHWFNTSVFSPLLAYIPHTNPQLPEGLAGPRFLNIDGTLAVTLDATEPFKLTCLL